MTIPVVHTDRVFRGLYDRGSGRFECLALERCRFESCGLSMTRVVANRSIVRDVQLRDCTIHSSFLHTAVLEDLLIDRLTTIGLLQAFGAVFRRVVLRGRVGRIMLSPLVSPALATPEEQAAFRSANIAFYRSVDWAIDIREADAEELEVAGIPGTLVRRNPENSILVKRSSVGRGDWNRGIENTAIEVAVRRILDYKLDDVVVVACKRSKHYAKDLRLFKVLRQTGVAEPD